MCANALWRNIRRLRAPKSDNWRSRSRNLFRICAEGRHFLHGDPTDCIRQFTICKALSRPERFKLLMNGNNRQPRVPTLKDLYGAKQSSLPWEEQQAEIVRFWTDSGDCWGFLFHHVSGTFYGARDQRLLIDWPLGKKLLGSDLNFQQFVDLFYSTLQ